MEEYDSYTKSYIVIGDQGEIISSTPMSAFPVDTLKHKFHQETTYRREREDIFNELFSRYHSALGNMNRLKSQSTKRNMRTDGVCRVLNELEDLDYIPYGEQYSDEELFAQMRKNLDMMIIAIHDGRGRMVHDCMCKLIQAMAYIRECSNGKV